MPKFKDLSQELQAEGLAIVEATGPQLAGSGPHG